MKLSPVIEWVVMITSSIILVIAIVLLGGNHCNNTCYLLLGGILGLCATINFATVLLVKSKATNNKSKKKKRLLLGVGFIGAPIYIAGSVIELLASDFTFQDNWVSYVGIVGGIVLLCALCYAWKQPDNIQ